MILSNIFGFIAGNWIKIVAVAGVAAAFIYVQSLRKTVEVLKANTAIMELSIEDQKTVIQQLQNDSKKYKEISDNLNIKNTQYLTEINDLRRKFEKNGRDFDLLLNEKPVLVNKIINKATKKELNCLEEITDPNKSVVSCE